MKRSERPAGPEWKATLAAVVGGSAAALFGAGLAVVLWFGGAGARELWREHREEQATLRRAHVECPQRYDPTEWGTPAQQLDGCVSDRMERHIWADQAHPVFYVMLAIPAALYLLVTAGTAWLAWGYWGDEEGRAWWNGRRARAG